MEHAESLLMGHTPRISAQHRVWHPSTAHFQLHSAGCSQLKTPVDRHVGISLETGVGGSIIGPVLQVLEQFCAVQSLRDHPSCS